MPTESPSTPYSVVLGGGGLAGIAWTIGVLAAWGRAGVPLLADAGEVIGTSAGSAVAARVLQDRDPAPAYDDLVHAEARNAELRPVGPLDRFVERIGAIHAADAPREEKLRALLDLASSSTTVPAADRRAVIAGRLRDDRWPGDGLRVVALAADTGRVVFTAASGVSVVDAVAASCAVAGLWPAVEIGGVAHIDGGMFSSTNADLVGNDRVVVIAPTENLTGSVDPAEAAVLDRAFVVRPSAAALAAFGVDPFDPETRGVGAVRGYEDGLAALTGLRSYLAR